MTTMASQITSLMVGNSTVYSDAVQRKHQSSASLAFVRGIHRDQWIPRTKGQLRGKCFHFMTSLCTDSCPAMTHSDWNKMIGFHYWPPDNWPYIVLGLFLVFHVQFLSFVSSPFSLIIYHWENVVHNPKFAVSHIYNILPILYGCYSQDIHHRQFKARSLEVQNATITHLKCSLDTIEPYS